MKKKLAFIDYWHHKYTRSNDFLRNELSKEFEITEFWWSKNSLIPLDELKQFDNIFFFHIIYPYEIIKKIGSKNFIWAPMYDSLNFRNNFFKWIFWKQIYSNNIKVLSFSQKIESYCKKNCINYLQLQYFEKPQKIETKVNFPYNILFWNRGDIKIEDWIEIFNPSDINKIYYIETPDPGKSTENINQKLLNQYKIKIIKREFRKDKNEFLDYLKKVDIFVAPRKKEGIGLPVVEAISYGKYIIGFNDSTMNEYIFDNKIGKLFQNSKIKIDKNDVINFSKYRLDNAEKKFLSWAKEKNNINKFVTERQKKVEENIFLKVIFITDNIKNIIKAIFKKNIYKIKDKT